MRHEKGDLNYSFEYNCDSYMFDKTLEWNDEVGIYADPRVQKMFTIFCEGYNACLKGV